MEVRMATFAERHASLVGDGEGDMDCVRCANPHLAEWFDDHEIEHALSGNCDYRAEG